MTLTRLLPIQLHAAAEMLTAPLLIVAPVLFGFPGPALVVAFVLGGLMIGSALHASEASPRVSAHLGFDLVALALATGSAVGLALAGLLAPAALFAAVAVLEGLLMASTRYTGPSPSPNTYRYR